MGFRGIQLCTHHEIAQTEQLMTSGAGGNEENETTFALPDTHT